MEALDSPSDAPVYLLESDFRRLRNRQDRELRARFDSIDKAIDEVKRDVAELKQDVTVLKQDVSEVKRAVKEGNTELMRITARFRNNTLRNPTMRIAPVVAYDSSGQTVSPDPRKFPRNAKEFYAMRDTSNERSAKMLNYLVGFYDVRLHHQGHSQSDSEASDDDDDSHEKVEPALIAVEILEDIVGLNEENFINFNKRAAELARRSPQPAVKRPKPPSTSSDRGPRKLPSRQVQHSPQPALKTDIVPEAYQGRSERENFVSGEHDRSFGEGQSSETHPSQLRIPVAFVNLRSIDSEYDPIESPTNKNTTPERRVGDDH